MYVRETEYEVLYWIQLTQNTNDLLDFVNTVMNLQGLNRNN